MILQITMFYNSFINFDDARRILSQSIEVHGSYNPSNHMLATSYVPFIVNFAEKDTWCEEYLIISTWV